MFAAGTTDQSALRIVTDHSIGGIRLGETSAAIAKSYGPGQPHHHPTYRSYITGRQETDVEFDSRQRAIAVSSGSQALTLEGQKLEKGAAYWRARLKPQGWRFSRCHGVISADSPSGHTGISFKGSVVFAAVISSNGLSAVTTHCVGQ